MSDKDFHISYINTMAERARATRRIVIANTTKSETGDKKVSLDGEEAKQKKR